jgi:hypothetical protein
LVWHQNNPSATEFHIRTVSIDELTEMGELAYPKFVKIDVEGAEGSVLHGMRRTLAATRPVLFVELLGSGPPNRLAPASGPGISMPIGDYAQIGKRV